jgi:N-methylhydantoinase A/oxoprolinase/acetone carboxylase beta subunit
MTGTHRLGFDIGGTFTDFVLVDEAGTMTLGKCLTTPDDPSRGVKAGMADLLADAAITGAAIDIAIHATTLITNALIQRKGARIALLTTAGFRDTLEMATEVRYDNYDLYLKMPDPLVPRDLRFDIPERMTRDGDVLLPLDEERVREVALVLREREVEAVAVVYLHGFRNPAHERQTSRILAEALPGVPVSLSSVVAPEIREYERTSTTTANAYVQPIVATYLDRAQAELTASGYGRQMYMMVSSGGIAGAESVKALPIRLLESGPTAGVLAAIHFARHLGIPDLVTFDMGGTTAKIGLIKNHAAKKSNVFEFGRVARFMKGSGLPVKIPMIELIEIGAGGGSIAAVDELGLLTVGPHSAGSNPGPACYGLGGARPTVTDANVILGNLDPGYFLGGAMRLDRAAAEAAFAATLVGRVGRDVQACARGVFQVVNHTMLAAMKVHIAERGEDPRRMYLFAFGGAGPAHAYELARALRMRGVIIPPGAGATSAMGLVATPVSFDFSRSLLARLDELRLETLGAVFAGMVDEGREVLRAAGIEPDGPGVAVAYQMDLRHLGQGREITVDIPADVVARGAIAEIPAYFYRDHLERFGHVHRHLPVELITCRASVSGPAVDLKLRRLATTGEAPAPKSTRGVFFPECADYVTTPVYRRAELPAGARLAGPAVIEERECTIIAGPSAQIRIDPFGCIFLDLPADPASPGMAEAGVAVAATA